MNRLAFLLDTELDKEIYDFLLETWANFEFSDWYVDDSETGANFIDFGRGYLTLEEYKDKLVMSKMPDKPFVQQMGSVLEKKFADSIKKE